VTKKQKNYENTLIAPDISILGALKIIDDASLQIALIVDRDRYLLGTVTDGDVRRGILAGIKLEEPVSKIMNKAPMTVPKETPYAEILKIMNTRKIHQIPVVDQDGRLTGLEWMGSVMEKAVPTAIPHKDISVILMLGGQGTRLHPLTDSTPKPMLPVGNKPLLETIVKNLVDHGFQHLFFSVNYKADVIQKYFGDGSAYGAHITYLPEKIRLGTAGALSLLPQKPEHPFIVMNGDILTNTNFAHLVDFHRQTRAHATMCVREYQQQVPYGIVQTEGTKLTSIVEKPSHSYFVNAGIYVLDPTVLDFVPSGRFFDMPQLFDELGRIGHELSVFPIREYWMDIGSFEDLERARGDYSRIFG
jgi:dTDP-glucose pyrophosphorylase